MNFPPKLREGYYACSSSVGGKLCLLLVGVRTFPLLRSRHKNPPIYAPHDIHTFSSWYFCVSCFMIDKAHGWGGGGGTFTKMRGRTWLFPHPGPIILWMPPPQGFTLCIKVSQWGKIISFSWPSDHKIVIVTGMCLFEHDFSFQIVESATPDLNVVECSHPCPLCWVCHLSFNYLVGTLPNIISIPLYAYNGLDHSIVHKGLAINFSQSFN